MSATARTWLKTYVDVRKLLLNSQNCSIISVELLWVQLVRYFIDTTSKSKTKHNNVHKRKIYLCVTARPMSLLTACGELRCTARLFSQRERHRIMRGDHSGKSQKKKKKFLITTESNHKSNCGDVMDPKCSAAFKPNTNTYCLQVNAYET